MEINRLEYGNPTQGDAAALALDNYLVRHFEELRQFPMPSNDSLLTREELNMVRGYLSVTESDSILKGRYRKYDMSGMDYLRQVIIQSGAPEDDTNRLVYGIVNDTVPLLARLKMAYQRPRPFQLARYHRLRLFPFPSMRANSPSYPSALTCQAALVCKALSHRYPQLAESLDTYAKDYALSRLYLGLHYPTDNDFAYLIADKIASDDQFQARYGFHENPRTISDPGGKAPDDPIGQVEPKAGSGEVSEVLRGPEPIVPNG